MTTINLAESQNLPFSCLPRLYFLLFAIVALHLSRVLYKFTLFYAKQTQFPPILRQKRLFGRKTNPIQTQFKANQTQFKANQTQFKANQTQFKANSKPIKPIFTPYAPKTNPIKPNFKPAQPSVSAVFTFAFLLLTCFRYFLF